MDNNRYITPELEMIEFETEDVITTSPVVQDPDMGKWIS